MKKSIAAVVGSLLASTMTATHADATKNNFDRQEATMVHMATDEAGCATTYFRIQATESSNNGSSIFSMFVLDASMTNGCTGEQWSGSVGLSSNSLQFDSNGKLKSAVLEGPVELPVYDPATGLTFRHLDVKLRWTGQGKLERNTTRECSTSTNGSRTCTRSVLLSRQAVARGVIDDGVVAHAIDTGTGGPGSVAVLNAAHVATTTVTAH